MKKRKTLWILIFIISIIILIYCVINSITVVTKTGEKITINQKIKNQIEQVIEGKKIQDRLKVSLNINTPYISNKQEFIVTLEEIDKIENKEEYQVTWGIDEKQSTVLKEKLELKFEFPKEGKNKCIIEIKKNEKTVFTWEKEIYYIETYEKQFLDEIELHGVTDYFMWMNVSQEMDLFQYSGEKIIRSDIRQITIEESGYILFDRTIPKMIENGYKIIGILGGFSTNFLGEDGKVSNQKDLDNFLEYAEGVIMRYPDIYAYEILNEPNIIYTSQEDIEWYIKMIDGVKEIIERNHLKSQIISGVTVNPNTETDSRMPSIEFLKKITESGAYPISDAYSYHLYDFSTVGKVNEIFKKSSKEHKEFINEIGGFQKIYLTEMGIEAKDEIEEEKQAIKIIQEEIMTKEANVCIPIVFAYRNTGGRNWGINSFIYEPKKAYYALKNYYENTNGSEYIGTINLEEGLETHVYDKDGKPKIITWSNNVEKNITIPHENFTAKDIYGNEIKNENGELTITTSPIYLDNIEEKYFYQAISNTATTKYTEFEEKFAEEIEKLPEIKQQTKNLKQQIEQIGKTETRIDEQTAKTLMQRHFQLGNSLINAYQNRRIETEKVKLSSMLDMLNDIGNSYEDLVTVTAKTRNADISQAKDLVKEVENIITSNSDIEIIYPAKILEFSKDYQEKAEYINGLEEENDIKTGLIVSKNLHSIYLSNWAKEFTNIYIDEYLKNNLIAENYSEKNITNQDVTVTLNIGDDTKITNNNGSNQYTFTENGEYTFEYERRGRKFRQTVKVENIDKQSPKITGVEEGQVYENKIKPIIEDENLETVRLIQDGRMIDNYINNAEIKEEGMYRIEAIDKAGNKTITSFEIIENISKEYIIENNIIKNIEANTTVEQFKENIKIQTEYNIQRDGQTLKTEEKIATGDILQIGDTQYTLIVRGDIDKDSKITIKDLILLRQQIIGEKTLEDTAKTAGDIDLNKKIDARDIVKLRKLILTNNQ